MKPSRLAVSASTFATLTFLFAPPSRADEVASSPAEEASPAEVAAPPQEASPVEVAPPREVKSPARLAESQHFTIDPVFDGVLIAGGFGFAGLTGLVLQTGEIRPTPPADYHVLLSIDRVAVTQRVDPNASRYSDFGLWALVAYAVVDPVLSGLRVGKDALIVDGVLYAETIALTEVFTNMTKVAVRRPRPVDYLNCSTPGAPNCSSTDLQLSFFSGHASISGSITATATYLAFLREPHGKRPWITLALGTAVTAFVSYERVRSGDHFPTDVIMGSLAGAAIGVLVPHIHRRREEAPIVWIGFAPTPGAEGGAMTLGGRF